jgi:hemerythrin
MAFLEWDSRFSVRIAEIDQQHKKLIGLINRLHESMQQASGRDALETAVQELSAQATVINEMVEYSSYHFSTEEKYMRQHVYPDYEKHKKEHEYFTNKVRTLKSDFDGGQAILSGQIMEFLKEWLSGHILGVDKKYEPFFQAKGLK